MATATTVVARCDIAQEIPDGKECNVLLGITAQYGEELPVCNPQPYWFNDGDVILHVEDNMFKLSRSLLSMSDVFKDMFEVAQCSLDNSIDGCPVVALADRASDWMVLLQWMLLRQESYAKSVSFLEPKMLDFDSMRFCKIVGALRLSTKYILPELRAIAIPMLIDLFPSLYEDKQLYWYSTAQAAEAIAVAYECQVPHVLPNAYYGLSIQFTRDKTDDGFFATMDAEHLARFRTIHNQLLAYHRQWRRNPLDGFCGRASVGDACTRRAALIWRAGLSKAYAQDDGDPASQFGLLHAMAHWVFGYTEAENRPAPHQTLCEPCYKRMTDLCLWRRWSVVRFIHQALGVEVADIACGERDPQSSTVLVELPCLCEGVAKLPLVPPSAVLEEAADAGPSCVQAEVSDARLS